MPVICVETLPRILEQIDSRWFVGLSHAWREVVADNTAFTPEQIGVGWQPPLVYGLNLDDLTLNVEFPPHERDKPSYQTIMALTEKLQAVLNMEVSTGILPPIKTGVWVKVLEEDYYLNSEMMKKGSPP